MDIQRLIKAYEPLSAKGWQRPFVKGRVLWLFDVSKPIKPSVFVNFPTVWIDWD